MINFSLHPAAVCVIKGTKLVGIPNGNSPISPEGCAPMGLKYLKMAIRNS
jgi:hypothetical protein